MAVGTLFVVLPVPQGPIMEIVWELLVGGGLLEVLPAALEKVAGGPLMAEVDLGPAPGCHRHRQRPPLLVGTV